MNEFLERSRNELQKHLTVSMTLKATNNYSRSDSILLENILSKRLISFEVDKLLVFLLWNSLKPYFYILQLHMISEFLQVLCCRKGSWEKKRKGFQRKISSFSRIILLKVYYTWRAMLMYLKFTVVDILSYSCTLCPINTNKTKIKLQAVSSHLNDPFSRNRFLDMLD